MNLVYGGSFNPPTLAHQAIIDKLINLYPEAKIIVVPVGDNYRKKDLAPFFHRAEMVKLLIEPYHQVLISTIEGVHPFMGTFNTLKTLSKSYENLHVVIGQDQLEFIDSWIKAKELLNTFPFMIMKRKESMDIAKLKDHLKDWKYHFTFIDFDMDISATMFRVNPQKQKELIPQVIDDYIIKHQLYKE